VTSGASGSVTKRPESLVNLEVSLKIQKALEAQGVKVIMVRTSQNVNISNSQRAAVANKAGADLLLRIHCDDVTNHSTNGLLTMVPSKNQWTGPIVAPSAKAGKAIHSAALKSTGAKDRGIIATSQMSGFNWSKVPAVIVEMGVMSDAAEDRLLSSPAYQQKLATGISTGVVSYLNSTR
jgi:N-acetylmuramoyl-L-alanine amidase